MDLLFENFELLADVPNGVQKLRELILQLAVQGKLVPQDPNDEPADELLKRINAEKEKLITEGKIKAEEPLTPIREDEKPYDLPQGWEWVKLKELSLNIHYGFTASANPLIKDYRLLRITDIQNDKVNWDYVPGCEISFDNAKKYLLNENDILIARTGGTIGKSYIVKNINVKAVFASYLIRIIPAKSIFPNYIKLFLGSFLYWEQLYANSMGTGQPNVNGVALSNLKFSLPPFDEQKRIAAKVEQLMALCDALEKQKERRAKKRVSIHNAAINKLLESKEQSAFNANWQRIQDNFDLLYDVPENVAELKQAILQLAVQGKLVPQNPSDEPASVLLEKIKAEKEKLIAEGKVKKEKPLPLIRDEEKPYDLPDGWEWVRLGQIKLNAFTGLERARALQSADFEYYYFKMNNITFDGKCDLSFLTCVDAGSEEVSRYSLTNEDFLFNTRNSYELVGKTCVFSGNQNDIYLFNNNILKIQFNELVNKVYLNFWFYSISGKMILDTFKSSTTNVAAIYQNKLMLYIIPFPPLEEQKRIVAKVNALMHLCDGLEEKLSKSQEKVGRLMNAVVQGVFNDAL